MACVPKIMSISWFFNLFRIFFFVLYSDLPEINSIFKSKTDGIAMTFFDYSKDFRYFKKNLLPKIRKF